MKKLPAGINQDEYLACPKPLDKTGFAFILKTQRSRERQVAGERRMSCA